MSKRPKVIYFASRHPSLTLEAFHERWLAHGALAMSLPIWANMWKYSQCDPLMIRPGRITCDAVGQVWYRSFEALASIAREPHLRQGLLEDEARTFSGYIRDCAAMTTEAVVKSGPETPLKLFVMLPQQDDLEVGQAFDDAVRIVRNDPVTSDYTAGTTFGGRVVYEAWYSGELSCSIAYRTLDGSLDTAHGLIMARERHLYGPSDA